MNRSDVLKDSLGRFLRNLFDLMVLNLLWTLCSLPVITMGPATCGLYRVTLKLARDESAHPVQEFFGAIRENFKSGLLLGLLAIVLAVVAVVDAWFALQQSGFLRTLYLALAILIAIVFLVVISFGFALQAMFENPLKVQLQNAFRLPFASLPKTLMLWLILLMPVLLILLLPPVVMEEVGFLYVILGVSGPVYAGSRILRDIFDRVNGAPVIPQPPVPEE